MNSSDSYPRSYAPALAGKTHHTGRAERNSIMVATSMVFQSEKMLYRDGEGLWDHSCRGLERIAIKC